MMVRHKLVLWMNHMNLNKHLALNMLVLGVSHMIQQNMQVLGVNHMTQNMKVQLEQVHMRVLGQVGNKKVQHMKVVL